MNLQSHPHPKPQPQQSEQLNIHHMCYIHLENVSKNNTDDQLKN